MNFDDYESLPTTNAGTHMMAGAISGIVEHGVMYPIDTVKTRMQSLAFSGNRSIGWNLKYMIQKEGYTRPVRGIATVVIGAGPAHAMYFATYEQSKRTFTRVFQNKHEHLVNGLSGCVASIIHDGISNPIEVTKQRLQMYNSPHSSVLSCISAVYRKEGWRAFYKSYSVQVFMNLPFQSIYFMTYEATQKVLNKDRTYNPTAHILSGATAGGLAAALTNPLDVVKTLINTQVPKTKSLFDAFGKVWKTNGLAGFFRGIEARMLYHMPGAATCWWTYETIKFLLKSTSSEDGVHGK